jgi:ArsR family transcriptional regulator
MQMEIAVDALRALAQESRLRVFRLLVQEGEGGLASGDIASRLGVTAATMSHHLDQLSQAGLVTSRRAGRSIIYSANYDAMGRLVDYLMENCCRGSKEADDAKTSRPCCG